MLDTLTRTPLILAGATNIPVPTVPASEFSDVRQLTLVAGTDIPAYTVAAFRPDTTSTACGDNIKDVDD